METTITYWGYTGIMEKKIETTNRILKGPHQQVAALKLAAPELFRLDIS